MRIQAIDPKSELEETFNIMLLKEQVFYADQDNAVGKYVCYFLYEGDVLRFTFQVTGTISGAYTVKVETFFGKKMRWNTLLDYTS